MKSKVLLGIIVVLLAVIAFNMIETNRNTSPEEREAEAQRKYQACVRDAQWHGERYGNNAEAAIDDCKRQAGYP